MHIANHKFSNVHEKVCMCVGIGGGGSGGGGGGEGRTSNNMHVESWRGYLYFQRSPLLCGYNLKNKPCINACNLPPSGVGGGGLLLV